MGDDPRIEQFKQMTEADPTNELGHFSLGKACLEGGRFDDAVTSLARVVELNPKMSKAFQLLGEAFDKAGQRDRAIEVMTRGVGVADGQGDRMPRDAMADRLREWSAPVPSFAKDEVQGAQETVVDGSGSGFQCSRCGQPRAKLEKRPFKGSLGETIHQNVCADCWREWIPMGTKVINELGLALSTPDGQQTYDQYMMEFLQLEDR